ncbi:MAG: hypothetical protein NXI27_19840 [Alphaproteobacteria bacterium]|nr:hypothetical protein [Alphaproteobacteria bacterium]
MNWPAKLQTNGWTGSTAAAEPVGDETRRWLFRDRIDRPEQHLLPGDPPDERNWADARVGWGLVMRDDPDVPAETKARAGDAPLIVQQLVEARDNAPVLRWDPALPLGTLRCYRRDGTDELLQLANLHHGTGSGAIPKYLLLLGSPDRLPWSLQYELQTSQYVGRLALSGSGLDHYVTALMNGWSGTVTEALKTVIWAVDHGSDDITELMRDAIAKPLHLRFSADGDLNSGCRFIDGRAETATAGKLLEALEAAHPSLIVSTSHGMTGPLADPDAMSASLGIPVDQAEGLLPMDDLLGPAMPGGAIWYAHACCSAGGDAQTAYSGLLPEGGDVDRLLKAVAGLGARTAPMPDRLLGTANPIRAFIGHVEPTFDWSVKSPLAGTPMTKAIEAALYEGLFVGNPVGMALKSCRDVASSLGSTVAEARRRYGRRDTSLNGEALACRLMWSDWRSLVLLGDPTARIPLPG